MCPFVALTAARFTLKGSFTSSSSSNKVYHYNRSPISHCCCCCFYFLGALLPFNGSSLHCPCLLSARHIYKRWTSLKTLQLTTPPPLTSTDSDSIIPLRWRGKLEHFRTYNCLITSWSLSAAGGIPSQLLLSLTHCTLNPQKDVMCRIMPVTTTLAGLNLSLFYVAVARPIVQTSRRAQPNTDCANILKPSPTRARYTTRRFNPIGRLRTTDWRIGILSLELCGTPWRAATSESLRFALCAHSSRGRSQFIGQHEMLASLALVGQEVELLLKI